MSRPRYQLNPEAAEFVPMASAHWIRSPARRINEEVPSQSAERASEDELELGVKSPPRDFGNDEKRHECANDSTLEFEEIEKMFNRQNTSTQNSELSDEFHFGPIAATSTPKSLEQLDGDAFFDFRGQVKVDNENINLNDTMSAQAEPNSCQHQNVDESKNSTNFDDTISDLGKRLLDNDNPIQITDLDKVSQDDEKELASPVGENDELLKIPSNDNVFQQNVEEKLLPEEFEFVNPPLNPVVPEKERLAKSPNIQSQYSQLVLVPVKIEQESTPEFTPGNSKPPECELKSASSFPEVEVTPKSELDNIESHIEELTLTSACEYTATSPVSASEEASAPVLVCESPVIDESCEIASKESSVSEQKQDKEIASHFPTDLLDGPKQDEDVTSSIKDDFSSPIESLLLAQIEQKGDEKVTSSVEDFVSSPIEALPGNLLEEIATEGEHGSTIKISADGTSPTESSKN